MPNFITDLDSQAGATYCGLYVKDEHEYTYDLINGRIEVHHCLHIRKIISMWCPAD